jgi:hypothetical protein
LKFAEVRKRKSLSERISLDNSELSFPAISRYTGTELKQKIFVGDFASTFAVSLRRHVHQANGPYDGRFLISHRPSSDARAFLRRADDG